MLEKLQEASLLLLDSKILMTDQCPCSFWWWAWTLLLMDCCFIALHYARMVLFVSGLTLACYLVAFVIAVKGYILDTTTWLVWLINHPAIFLPSQVWTVGGLIFQSPFCQDSVILKLCSFLYRKVNLRNLFGDNRDLLLMYMLYSIVIIAAVIWIFSLIGVWFLFLVVLLQF